MQVTLVVPSKFGLECDYDLSFSCVTRRSFPVSPCSMTDYRAYVEIELHPVLIQKEQPPMRFNLGREVLMIASRGSVLGIAREQ